MSVIMNRHSLVNTADPPSTSSASLSPWRPRAAVTSQPAALGEVTKEKSEALKSCLRVFVELLFTQVGVGCLLISYTILGALAFQYIETLEAEDQISQVLAARTDAVHDLWNVTDKYNTLNIIRWRTKTEAIIAQYQSTMIT
eukprot:UN00299